MYCDLKKPNLNWVSESDIARSSTVIGSTFASLGIVLLVVILPVAVYFVLVPQFAYFLTFLTVLAFGVIFSFVFILSLYKNIDYYFDKTE